MAHIGDMPRKPQLRSDQVRVRVLGASELHIGSRKIGMSTEGLFAFALYLTTRAGERIARDELMEVFWPVGDEEPRRHAMRQMVYRLRQKGVQFVEDGEFLQLDPTLVDSDLRNCRRAAWADEASADEVSAAAALGPSFSQRCSPGFLEWFDGIRGEVAAQVRKAALRHLVQARREGRWADLDRWAREILRSDPLNEEATLARAESAAMGGSKVSALEILDNYLEEVGLVSPELGKPAMVLRKRIAEKRADWSRRSPTEVSLVGRSVEMGRLTGAIDLLNRGTGDAISILGAPGIGKTRLATEACSYAQLIGIRCARVRATASDSGRPLAAATELISAALQLPGILGMPPGALTLLREVATSPDGRHPATSTQLPRREVADALTEALQSISENVRVAVHIDDGHHVDEASREIIGQCISHTSSHRILWLITSRANPNPWVPGISRIQLGPLSATESSDMAARICRAVNRAATEEELLRIARVAGGNPLFLREMAAHHIAGRAGLPLPTSLQDSIRARLGSLPDFSVRLIRAVALLGKSATLVRCLRVSHLDAGAFADTTASLEADGILFLDGQEALALHECWQQEILDGIAPLARATLALECAEAVLEDALESNVIDLWRAGSLLAVAGSRSKARECFLKAADSLLATGMYEDAAVALQQARATCAPGPIPLSLATRLSEVALAHGRPEEVLSLTDSLPKAREWGPEESGDATEWAVSVAQRYDALSKTSANSHPQGDLLVRAASCQQASPFARHYAAFVGARLAIWGDDSAGLLQFLDAARSIAPSPNETVAAGFTELIYSAERGSPDEFNVACAAQELAESTKAPARLIRQSMRFRAVGLRMHGRVSEASALAKQVFADCTDIGQPEVAAACAELLSFLFLDQEDLESAEHWIAVGQGVDRQVTNRVRTKGLTHAEMRLLLQKGDAQAVIEDMTPRLDDLSADAVVSRRSGELLTLYAAMIAVGQTSFGKEELTRIADSVIACKPSFLLDYPAEMAARCLRHFSPKEADSFIDGFRKSRREYFNRPLAPFFREINARGDFPVAKLVAD